jgi:cbb3-type cytochrome oxidase subunit 3
VVAYSNEVIGKKEIVKLSTEQDKNDLKNFIDTLEKFPNTDLSVGVKEAIKALENSHEKDYRPLIVLFADGNNDLNKNKGKTTQQAIDDLNAAVADAKAKDFPIYVIGLNANGTLNKDALQKVASTTNGKYFETSNANDLPGILSQIFADHLKLKIVPVNELIGNGYFQDVTISIPNENVIEANVSLVSSQPVEVKVVDPTGKELTIPSDNIFLSKSKSYSMLKLIKPVQGNWTLKVKSLPQDKVDINLVFNYDLQLKLAPIDTQSIKDGDIVKVSAFFEDNGKPITGKDFYKTMKPTLFIKDIETGKTEQIELAAKEQGFSGQFIIGDSANYQVVVKAEGNSFYRETQPQKITIQKATTPVTAKTSQSEGMPQTQSPWQYVVIALIAIVFLLGLVFYLFIKKRKENRQFSGQVIVEIKDENTGESREPQAKNLKALKGEFTLRKLFMLDTEFTETDLITFVPLTDNALLFFNKSNCTIEKNGVAIDAETFHRFKRNDKLRIKLTDSNQSIYVEISSLEKTKHPIKQLKEKY